MSLKDRLAALERRHPARLVRPAETESEYVAARLAVEAYLGEEPVGEERARAIAEARHAFQARHLPMRERIRAVIEATS